MSTFTEHLRGRTDDELIDLLLRRPDLAHPTPATLFSLTARATSRPSMERALSTVDAGVLQVIESVVALTTPACAAQQPPTGVRVSEVLVAVGGTPGNRHDEQAIRHRLDTATTLALLYSVGGSSTDPLLRSAPGLDEAFGPYPAGLASPEPPSGKNLTADAIIDDLSPGARSVLDALTWGPPMGLRPTGGPAAAAVDELLTDGLLHPFGGDRVLLPREIAWALRKGRTHHHLNQPPIDPHPHRRTPELVAAESTGAAESVVRSVSALIELWGANSPGVLRAGGVSARDLRRTARTLDLTEPATALIIELAAARGLIRDDGEEQPQYVPTTLADDWVTGELPERWASLVLCWAHTTRWPAVVGTRDDHAQLRPALGVEQSRSWAPRLRRQVLDILASPKPGVALTTEAVHTISTWCTPRAVPPAEAIDAVLREAAWLGITGAGALATSGHVLTGLLGEGETTLDHRRQVAAALAADLPAAVDTILLQGDLTGIVPGRPSAAIERLLTTSAVVESRGGALTVRFTPESVRAALDGGSTAEELLAELARFSPGGVPQPLEYLVRDAARRHGLLRGGVASSYIRAEDPTLLAGLVEDPKLASLGLMRLAPTVIAARASLAEMLRVLRDRGLAPVAETPDGQVLRATSPVRRLKATPRSDQHNRPTGTDQREHAAALVHTLRNREEHHLSEVLQSGPLSFADHATGSASQQGTDDLGETLALLREATADRTEVWLEMVGPRGAVERRRVRPLRVDGGRVRVVDTERDAEIVVAVHRVAAVTRITPSHADHD